MVFFVWLHSVFIFNLFLSKCTMALGTHTRVAVSKFSQSNNTVFSSFCFNCVCAATLPRCGASCQLNLLHSPINSHFWGKVSVICHETPLPIRVTSSPRDERPAWQKSIRMWSKSNKRSRKQHPLRPAGVLMVVMCSCRGSWRLAVLQWPLCTWLSEKVPVCFIPGSRLGLFSSVTVSHATMSVFLPPFPWADVMWFYNRSVKSVSGINWVPDFYKFCLKMLTDLKRLQNEENISGVACKRFGHGK